MAESKTAEALQAQAVANEAREEARGAQLSSVMRQELEDFFQRGLQSGRFFPVGKEGKMADKDRFGFICDDIADIRHILDTAVKELKDALANNYVTKEAFWPVKALVFGFVGIMLTALTVAIVALVITTPK